MSRLRLPHALLMPIPNPQSLKWPADRAVLLVHGVGSARPGDYDPLVAQLTNILAHQPKRYAIYMFYYDYINEWFSQKLQAPLAFNQLANALHARLGGPGLGNTVAAFLGDVIWPVLSFDARDAMRIALLRQIQQIFHDGATAGVRAPDKHVSIIAHSMGCFHTYEALHTVASDPDVQLGPTQGIQFDNVIFMASPVQMIRTVGGDIRPFVPRAGDLACLDGAGLSMPTQDDGFGTQLAVSKNTVAIAGNLDPVGGYVFRDRLDWAYMNLPGQISKIDQQEVIDMKAIDLQMILQQSLQDKAPPRIMPDNPHDWGAYVARHADDLRSWLA